MTAQIVLHWWVLLIIVGFTIGWFWRPRRHKLLVDFIIMDLSFIFTILYWR